VRDHFRYAAQCGLDIVFTLDGNGKRTHDDIPNRFTLEAIEANWVKNRSTHITAHLAANELAWAF
jgi:hypothetical protein